MSTLLKQCTLDLLQNKLTKAILFLFTTFLPSICLFTALIKAVNWCKSTWRAILSSKEWFIWTKPTSNGKGLVCGSKFFLFQTMKDLECAIECVNWMCRWHNPWVSSMLETRMLLWIGVKILHGCKRSQTSRWDGRTTCKMQEDILSLSSALLNCPAGNPALYCEEDEIQLTKI